MSYNTRNTRQGAGRGGSNTAQIMYHQQQTRPGAQAQTQARLPTNAGGVPSSGYGQQAAQVQYTGQTASMPAFSTQPKPQAQPQAQPQAPPQAPPQATPVATPTKVYEYQNQQPAALPKVEQVSPVKPEGEVDCDMESAEGVRKRPAWMKNKWVKVPTKVKRRRQNARLRKILQPKSALIVLSELMKGEGGAKFTFHEQPSALAGISFVVNAEVDGKNHIGQGASKNLAKLNAAENALKAILLEKMAAQVRTEPMDHDGASTPAVADNGDGAEVTEETEEPDEVPWISMASFALYKLFTDWQNQGTHVPMVRPKSTPAATTEKSAAVLTAPMKQAPMKLIPENPTSRHPVMLLNHMRPGCKFVEESREGTPQNMTFTLSVTVDEVKYEGVAKNKKEAKKAAAKAAILGCFNIQYD